MSRLVGYGSSDDEDDADENSDLKSTHTVANENSHNAKSSTENEIDRPVLTAGPHPGPSRAPETSDVSAPTSPYATQRAAMRSLTLPTIPNLEIPPSPPGSPPHGADQKLEHFLGLKKKGIHFNAKLASSSALKNPSLLPKLMDFAGIKSEKQYATIIPNQLCTPSEFPKWAFKDELANTQQEVTKKKEEEGANIQRESIEFLSTASTEQSSRIGTPGIGAGKGAKGSAAERVMAGLQRGVAGNEGARLDASSRSPKRRKRSRSR